MKTTRLAGLFKPSRLESRADNTTRVARMIVESESANRDAKTERLRLARLAREAEESASAPAKSGKARRGRSR
ncbi:MAG TPA: hypothetical protein VFK86_12625 [Bauldia sp.]|nr:hypothetical protein [Bauldia sp.]